LLVTDKHWSIADKHWLVTHKLWFVADKRWFVMEVSGMMSFFQKFVWIRYWH